MAVNAQLRSDDHVLLLDIPSVAELQVMSRILMSGSLVAIGSEDDVESARRAMAEFDNVLFIAATPDRIPWREAYFTKIIVPPQFERIMAQIGGEVQRLLRPGGVIVRSTEAV